MPRKKTYAPEDLADQILKTFWQGGYVATSMDDLVRATGVGRYGIYETYGDKHRAFLAAFDLYQTKVVSPAFSPVEADGAGLDAIRGYFDTQIALAEQGGLPGPGCLVGNAMTEVAPHDPAVAKKVAAHNARLQAGFAAVLARVAPTRPAAQHHALAQALTTFATGLWAQSRLTDEADALRRSATAFLDLIERDLA